MAVRHGWQARTRGKAWQVEQTLDDVQRRLAQLLIDITGGHQCGGAVALLGELEAAVRRMGEDVLLERRQARAAADGHDHVRETLLAIAALFGRVDDLDTLPARVRELKEQRATLLTTLPASLEAIRESACPQLDEACYDGRWCRWPW